MLRTRSRLSLAEHRVAAFYQARLPSKDKDYIPSSNTTVPWQLLHPTIPEDGISTGPLSRLSVVAKGDLLLCPWMPPIYPLKTVVPLGAALLIFQGIAELIRSIYALKNAEWPDGKRYD